MSRGRWLWYVVGGLHGIGMLLLLPAAIFHPAFVGLGVLAYTFGLRHAFDVDHIAAIDNTVRKLVQERKDPRGVGLFFSLGHSTVVLCLSAVTAIAVRFAEHWLPQWRQLGGFIGLGVSGAFLLFVGILNLVTLIGMVRLMQRPAVQVNDTQAWQDLLSARGLVTRLIGPLLRVIQHSWHMVPIGFLFGLGFDTASEVAVLGMSATVARQSVSLLGVLALPFLFAAGMSLLDTADGIFMTNAYRFALATPARKMRYNLVITGVGVVTALGIGAVELAQILLAQQSIHNRLAHALAGFNFGVAGLVVVLVFAAIWALAYGFYKSVRLKDAGVPEL